MDTRTRILNTTWQLLEEDPKQSPHMRDIAKAVGISRQALYLHFSSRTELMIATMRYVDEAKGLNEQLGSLQTAATGVELLEKSVVIWGNYIPEIYGIAKTMMSTRNTDEAAAAAWDDSMKCLQDACQEIITVLADEKNLVPEWSQTEALEMLCALLSINTWEELTVERGWSTAKYIDSMQKLLKRSFIRNSEN